ncbi:MAG: glycosyltransferase family 2 protein [Mogibacterium sp.]|nr:glycosyltransferase family 2 protein [Mogibacterium sp.]
MEKTYKISVIIPVYNVRDYLDECLASIASQTIGFSDIQVILVNDGSPDDSAAVCRRFAAAHPENVIYAEQPNSGVSAARNRGIGLAEGELITFLDGDDKWSAEAFETAYEAYKAHPGVSVFSCRMVFFDGETGEHQLNYKYEEDRVIDITEDYSFPQLSSSSVFITADAVKGHSFTEGLKYSEDFRFINEILLERPEMMLLRDPVYWYRRRPAGDSAIQTSVSDPDYYVPTCRSVYEYLFDRSRDMFGHVLRYLQYCVMYDLRWRLKIPLAETGLDEEPRREYFDLLVKLLEDIDDDIILGQKRIALALQLYALSLKHSGDVSDRISADDAGIIRYEDHPVFDLTRQPLIRIDSLRMDDDAFEADGQINYPFDDDRFCMRFCLNGVSGEIAAAPSDLNAKTYLEGVLKSNLTYSLRKAVDYSAGNELYFTVSFSGREFITAPEYMTSTELDRKSGELNEKGRTAYRSGHILCITRQSKAASFSRRLRRKLRSYQK